MERIRPVLLLLFLIPVSGMAQSTKDSWDNLKQLAPGQRIRIVLNDAKSHTGQLQSWNDEGLVVRTGSTDQTIERPSVLRVSTKGTSHRTRNALIGAGVGAGVGAAGFGACDYREVIPCGGKGAAIGAVFIAPVGAAVGALMPTGRWHDVYRAR